MIERTQRLDGLVVRRLAIEPAGEGARVLAIRSAAMRRPVDDLRRDATQQCSVRTAEGSFAFANLAPGEHVLRVQPTSLFAFTPVEQRVSIAAGETREVAIELDAQPPCEVEILVTRDGAPAAGASVLWMPESKPEISTPERQRTFVTDTDGRARAMLASGRAGVFVIRTPIQTELARSASTVTRTSSGPAGTSVAR